MTTDNKVQRLVNAAKVMLDNLIDAEQEGPCDPPEDCDFPRDKKGRIWYPDAWELKQAVEAIKKDIRAKEADAVSS